MTVRRFKRRQKAFWRGATQQDRYEYLVDGPSALDEIKDFHDLEERVLVELLKKYVERKEKVVFIEIGCGPGRVVRKISRLILENPTTWGQCIEYVVGVDFEIRMIQRAIGNLVSGEPRIRTDWAKDSLAVEFAKSKKENLKKIRDALRNRVLFINTDARQPFLRCESITPIVALMFGTLGNIPQTDLVLRRVSDLCWPKGEAMIVAFNRENNAVGMERYMRLAQQGFEPLENTEWKEENGMGVFRSSPGGFYSRWFSRVEFRQALQRRFEREFEVMSLDTIGLCSVVKPKTTLKRFVHLLPTRNGKHPSLHLLCPKCGEFLQDLPLTKEAMITCKRNGDQFDVRQELGFSVPVLEANNVSTKIG
jgi:SAM-dependent methyltransferase